MEGRNKNKNGRGKGLSNKIYQKCCLQIQEKKNDEQQKLGKKLDAVQATAEKEKDMLQVRYES